MIARRTVFIGLASLLAWALWLHQTPSGRAQETPSAGVHELLSAIPGDAQLAVVVDLAQLSEVLPILPAEALIGAQAPVSQALDAVIADRFGVHVGGVTLWAGFIGYDEDAWALLGMGPVTGTPTGEEALSYRGETLYVASDGAIVAAARPEGIAIGTFEAVTGVIDVVNGGIGCLADAPLSAPLVSAAASGAPFYVLVAGEEFLEDADISAIDPDISVQAVSLELSATRTRISINTGSAAAATTASARLDGILAVARASLDQVRVAAEDADELVEELGLRMLYAVASSMLDGALSQRADGVLLIVDASGSPAVSLFGMMAAVAVPAFQRYSTRSMTTEATMNVRRLFDSSVSYYDTDHTSPAGMILPPQFPASQPRTPAEVPCGAAVVPAWRIWDTPTWQALNFAVSDPQRYSYQYDSNGTGIGATFTATAFGDLDCDGVLSTFLRVGEVDERNEVRGGAGLYRQNELE